MLNPSNAAPVSQEDFVIELRKGAPNYSIVIPFGTWLEATNRAEAPRIERDLKWCAQQLMNTSHIPGGDAFTYKGPELYHIAAFETGVSTVFLNHAPRVRLIKVGEGASESSRTVKFNMRETSSGKVKVKTMTLPASQVLAVGKESFVPAWFIFKSLEEKMTRPQLARATSWVRDGDRQYVQVDHGFKFLDDDLCWPHASDFLVCMSMVKKLREELIADLPRLRQQAWIAGQPERDADVARAAELHEKKAGFANWRQRLEAAKMDKSQSPRDDSHG